MNAGMRVGKLDELFLHEFSLGLELLLLIGQLPFLFGPTILLLFALSLELL